MRQALEKHPTAGVAAGKTKRSRGFSTAAQETGPRARKGSFRACHGFTLLEVMVAVAVLGIAMTTILYGQAQSLRAQARSQNVTLATMMAMQKLEEVLTVGRTELPGVGESEEGLFDPPYDFLHWTLRVEENELLPEMIRDVHLTVYWNADSEGQSSFLRTKETGGNSLEVCLYVANLS